MVPGLPVKGLALHGGRGRSQCGVVPSFCILGCPLRLRVHYHYLLLQLYIPEVSSSVNRNAPLRVGIAGWNVSMDKLVLSQDLELWPAGCCQHVCPYLLHYTQLSSLPEVYKDNCVDSTLKLIDFGFAKEFSEDFGPCLET